ncbi:maestro heat-like repeat-containing protein family member 1 isoform 1-T14 [Cyanocitta cristata]
MPQIPSFSRSHTCAMWRALGTEPSLTSQILEQLLETLSREIPYKESKSFLLGSGSERVATPLPLAATCALDELMSVPEAAAAVLERFPTLFQSLLLRLGCSVGVQLPKFLQGREKRSQLGSAPRSLQPCSCAVETLKAMLERAGNDDVVRDVGNAGGWELMGIPERHHDGIALLAGAMARLCGPRLPPIVRSLIPVLGSVFECQRVTSTAFLAELLNHNVVNDLILLEPLLDALTALEKDSCLLVRILALRGLGNVTSGCPEKIRRHGSQLLASMVNGMDDKDDPNNLVALEAMSSLSKLLDHLEERDVQSMLLHIAIRIRPFFDSSLPRPGIPPGCSSMLLCRAHGATGIVPLELSHWNCAIGIVPLELSHRNCPTRIIPLELCHWNCPIGIVPLELSHWNCPNGIVPPELSHWDYPIGSVPLELSHRNCPTGIVPLELSHWNCPSGIVPLELFHWDRAIGIIPLELSHWNCPTGITPLELSHWNCPIGIVSLELSCWDHPTGIVPPGSCHWNCPSGIVPLGSCHWDHPIGIVLLGSSH